MFERTLSHFNDIISLGLVSELLDKKVTYSIFKGLYANANVILANI